MTIDADIRDQAYQFFIQEAPELLNVIETELVNLVQERSTNKIHNMMRAAHSLKGGAASVGLPVITQLSHRLEDFFKTLHHEDLIIDQELEGLLLQTFDLLRLSLNQQIDTGNIDPEYIAEVATPILIKIEAKLGDFLGSETELPNSIDLGVDIALSIFEIDVAEGLDRLRDILDHPQDRVVAGELRAQAEVFSGISELLNMPGLGAIAQATISALDANPNMVTEIAHYAMQDFEAARQGVIAGDRTQGGHPSDRLIALSGSEALFSEALLKNGNLVDNDFADLDDLLSDSDRLADLDLMFRDDNPELDQIFTDSTITTSGSLGDELTDDFSLDNLFGDNSLDLLPISLDDQLGDASSSQNLTKAENLDFNLDETLGASASEDRLSINQSPIDELFAEDLLLNLDHGFTEEDNPTDLSADANIENLAFDLDDVFGEDVTDNLSLDEVFGAEMFGDMDIPEDLSEATFIQDVVIPDLLMVEAESKDLIDEIVIGNSETGIKASAPAKFAKYTSSAPAASAVPESQLSVRINIDRLEQMNNLVGELVINRNVLSLQNEQLQETIQELLRRFGKFKKITSLLQATADRTAASSDRYGSTNNGSGSKSNYPQSDFDSLELDTYGELYGVMQSALEDLAQIEETVEDVTILSEQSVQTLEQQRQTVTRLREDLMWARMLPLSEVLNRFPRNIRDLSSKYKKPVDLKLSGTGVLVDKAILEKLYDPLQHLLRNAFDHGIEPSATRLSQHKSERGQIEIRAFHQGSQTLIEVRDDGQGINLSQIRRKALAQSLISEDQELTDSELLDVMFQPGFSTSDKVTELSGRGVGLDVVRSQIQSLKGSVSVAFEQGIGTTFTLKIPLTLSIANLLICVVGRSVFAIASSSIEEIVIPKPSQVSQSKGHRFLQWRDREVPMRHLSEFLDFRCPLPESLPNPSLFSVPTPSDWALPLLIVRQNQEIMALEIDRLITEQESVVKPLGVAIAPPPFIYGCTILGDGSLIPILDSQEILVQLDRPAQIAPPKIAPTQSATLLIVDDSIALRQTLALTLQKSGFRVLQAKDGLEAIEQLEKNSTIQLVICDIEMPNMNGFEFLTHRRQNPDLKRTPVIMLTSRSSDKHRRLAMHLGATSYFTKPYLEREFLSAIKNTLTTVSVS